MSLSLSISIAALGRRPAILGRMASCRFIISSLSTKTVERVSLTRCGNLPVQQVPMTVWDAASDKCIRQVFNTADQDNDGRISPLELRAALEVIKQKAIKQQVGASPISMDVMARWVSLDDDDLITFDEYRRVIRICYPSS